MAKEKKLYRRRLSLDESREGFVFISKDAKSMFPPPGESFKATLNGAPVELSVESISCTCRGPNNPHEHQHISLPSLKSPMRLRRGSLATIRRDGEKYTVEIR